MMTRFLHTIRFTTSLAALAAVVVLCAPATLRADRSAKKGVPTSMEKRVQAKDRKILDLLTLGTPLYGALDATLMALDNGIQQKSVTAPARPATTAPSTARLTIGADSSRKESRIIFARATADVFSTRVELAADENQIEVGIYNMLGKKVQDVYRGAASRGQHDYSQPVSDLPEGVYICIMQGSDFRRAEKFYLSR